MFLLSAIYITIFWEFCQQISWIKNTKHQKSSKKNLFFIETVINKVLGDLKMFVVYVVLLKFWINHKPSLAGLKTRLNIPASDLF